MPCWYYEKDDLVNTPSSKDGIDGATETRYRKEGARFIIDAGTSQGLRYDTMATGVIYFHRFYMCHSFKDFPRFVTGAACLFLAGKVEETPKKCKDIIRMAKVMVPEHHFSTFGDDPKEEIMTYERILLQTIKFDLQVDHPYSYLLKYAKTLKGDKTKIQQLVQMAWTFVNDSLCTTLCLQWEPHIVAVAFLYLAGRLSKSDLLEWSGKNAKVKWWEQLADDVDLEIMEDICHLLLDLYATGQQPKPAVLQSKGATKRSRPKTPPVAGPETIKISDDSHASQQTQPDKSRETRSHSQSRGPPPPPSSSGSVAASSSHAKAHAVGKDHPDKPSTVKAPPPPLRSAPKESGVQQKSHVNPAVPAPPPQRPPVVSVAQSYPVPVSYPEPVPTSSYSGPPPVTSQVYPAYQHPPVDPTVSTAQPGYSQQQYPPTWNFPAQQVPPANTVHNYVQPAYNMNQPPPGYPPNPPPQVAMPPAVPPPPPQQQQQQQQQVIPQQPQMAPQPQGPPQQPPYSQPYSQYPPPPLNVPPPVNIPPPAHNMSVPPPLMGQPPPQLTKPPPMLGQPPPAQMPPNQPPPSQPFPNFPPPTSANQVYIPPPQPGFDMMRMPGPQNMPPSTPQGELSFPPNPSMGLATVRITGRDSGWQQPPRRPSHGGANESWNP
ncbi:uncharacterized protein [Asterias amurensis]|uniref:uncharacterized protein n=1 Tax=Asterias amurensis TaxID=7602 RepID=UPI003AB4F000